jgi:hypothetical protein
VADRRSFRRRGRADQFAQRCVLRTQRPRVVAMVTSRRLLALGRCRRTPSTRGTQRDDTECERSSRGRDHERWSARPMRAAIMTILLGLPNSDIL